MTAPQQPEEPTDWYDEPGGQSPEQRVDWETSRREAEAQPPTQAPWEQVGDWGRQALDWMAWPQRNIGLPTLGVASQLQMGEPMDWETAPGAWERYAEGRNYPWGVKGLMEGVMDPLNLAMGTGLGTAAARRLPLLRPAAEMAMGLRGAGEVGPFSRALGTGLQWFDVPGRFKHLPAAMEETMAPTTMAEATKGIRGLTGREAPHWWDVGARTMGGEAHQAYSTTTDVLAALNQAVDNEVAWRQVVDGLAEMGRTGADVVPDVLKNTIGEKLPLSRQFRVAEAVLGQMTPDQIRSLGIGQEALDAAKDVARLQGPERDAALKTMAQAASRIDDAISGFVGGNYLRDAAGKETVWNPGLFNVKEQNAIEKGISAFKDFMSKYVYMGPNPAYKWRNFANNYVTIAARGVMPWGDVTNLRQEISELTGYMPKAAEATQVGTLEGAAQSYGRIPAPLNQLQQAAKDEANGSTRAFYTVYKSVRDELVKKRVQMTDWIGMGIPQEYVPAVQNLMLTTGPQNLVAVVRELLGRPNAAQLLAALGEIPTDAAGPTLRQIATRGDKGTLIRYIEDTLQAAAAPTTVGIGRLPEEAIRVVTATAQQADGAMTRFGETLTQATQTYLQRTESATNTWDKATAVATMLKEKSDAFQTFMANMQQIVPSIHQVIAQTDPQAADALRKSYDAFQSAWRISATELGTRRTWLNTTFAKAQSLKGKDRDAIINTALGRFDADRSWLFDTRWNPQMTAATSRFTEVLRALGVDAQFGDIWSLHRGTAGSAIGGTARGVAIPKGAPIEELGDLEEAAKAAGGEAYRTWGEQALANLQQVPDYGAGMAPEVAQALEQWASQAGRIQLTEINAVATKTGEYFRHAALLNYSDRRVIDSLLSLIFPYHYWYTRSFKNWAELLLHRPQYMNWYVKSQDGLEKLNEGLPERLKHTVPLPWFGGDLHLNPSRMLLPFSSLTEPFIPEERQKTPAGRAAALIAGVGPQPYAPAMTAAALSGAIGPKEAWIGRFAPFSRPIQVATAQAGIGGPTGVNIEQPLQKALGLQEGDRWDPYRAQRWLREEVTGGRIDRRQAERAIANQKGPLWDRAMQASLQRQGYPELTGFLTGLRPQLVAPEEKKYYRELRPEYQATMKAAQEGGGKALQQQFYKEHPDYSIWGFGRGTQAEAQTQLRENDFWEKLNGSREFHRQERTSLLPWQPEYRASKDAERNAGNQLRQQYGEIDLRPSLRAMNKPELQQYVKDGELQKASDAFFAADVKTEDGQRFRRRIIQENPDLQAYWQRNDSPLEALWNVRQSQISDAWAKWRDARDRGASGKERAGIVQAGFQATQAEPAENLIAAVMKQYPGRWTEEELRQAFAGVTVPGMEQTTQARAATTGAGGPTAGGYGGAPYPPRQPRTYLPRTEAMPGAPPRYRETPPASWLRPRRVASRGGGGGGAPRPAKGPVNWQQYYALPRASEERIEWLEANGIQTDASRFHWDRWQRYSKSIGALSQLLVQYFQSTDREAFITAHPELGHLMTLGRWPNQFKIPETLDELLAQLEDLWKKAEEYQSRSTPKPSPKLFLGA